MILHTQHMLIYFNFILQYNINTIPYNKQTRLALQALAQIWTYFAPITEMKIILLLSHVNIKITASSITVLQLRMKGIQTSEQLTLSPFLVAKRNDKHLKTKR